MKQNEPHRSTKKQKTVIIPLFIPFEGCDNRCIFCNQNAITNISSSTVIESAKSQLNLWLQRVEGAGIDTSTEATEVAFYGGTFTKLPSQLRKELYEVAKPFQIRLSTCPDSIGDEFLAEVDQYPIKTIEFGVQSMVDRVLKANNRRYTADDVKSIFRYLSPKVDIAAQFMVGMYGESRDDLIYTAKHGSLLKSKYSRIYPTLVLKDTVLADKYFAGEYAVLPAVETLLRSTWLYINLTASGSKVIRMGLPPEVQNGNSIVAGFWHPAFGDLVKTVACATYAHAFGMLPDIPYTGYKSYLKDRFSLPPHVGVDTMIAVSKKILEYYIEGDKWFAEEQIVEIATELSC